jgi:peptide/nickel transport system permease protein
MSASRLAENLPIVVGAVLLFVVLVACFIVGDVALRVDPNYNDVPNRFAKPFTRKGAEMLGTDQLGRSILARLLDGGKRSFIIATIAVILQLLVGCTLGLVSGLTMRRWLSALIMRIVDLQLAFPFIYLALFIMAIAKPSLTNLIILLVVSGWGGVARITRGQALVEIEKDYVQGARVLGASAFRIAVKYILPNLLPTLATLGLLHIGGAIVMEAAISFLGMGIKPPDASWGNMIFDGRIYIHIYPWLIIVPGIALFVTLFSIHLIADGLRKRSGGAI